MTEVNVLRERAERPSIKPCRQSLSASPRKSQLLRLCRLPAGMFEIFPIKTQGLQRAQCSGTLGGSPGRCAHQFATVRQVGQDNRIQGGIGCLCQPAVLDDLPDVRIDEFRELLISMRIETVLLNVDLDCCQGLSNGFHSLPHDVVSFPFDRRPYPGNLLTLAWPLVAMVACVSGCACPRRSTQCQNQDHASNRVHAHFPLRLYGLWSCRLFDALLKDFLTQENIAQRAIRLPVEKGEAFENRLLLQASRTLHRFRIGCRFSVPDE